MLHRQLSLCIVIVTAFAGCGDGGPTLSSVTGTLTKGGKPLAGVAVNFSTETGQSSAGLTNSEGKFVLISATGKKGAVVGKHKVTLSGGPSVAAQQTFDPVKMAAGRDKGGKRGNPGLAAPSKDFPPEYGDTTKSPLNYEVKAGSNDFDIPIP